MANVSHYETGSNPFVIRGLGSPLESARLILSDAAFYEIRVASLRFYFQAHADRHSNSGPRLADMRLKTKAEIFRLTETASSISLSCGGKYGAIL